MRWVLRILVVIVVIVVLAAVILWAIGNSKINQTYDIPPQALALTIPTDAVSIAHGRHLATAIGKCVDCHGANLGGQVFLDVPPFIAVAPNLTRGQGGIGSSFTDADFVRAIRHGLDPDGKPLIIMPSEAFVNFTDADLANLIAYVKSVPPVDRTLPDSHVKLLGYFLTGAGMLPPPPAAQIDHAAPSVKSMTPTVSVEYGHYLALSGGCISCHGAGLSGGPIPGLPPDSKPAQNITPAGIGTWTDAQLTTALRTGKRPDGSAIDLLMPWPDTALMTDDELKAVILYLRSVPSKETGGR